MYQGGSISLQLVQNSYPTTWLEYRGLLNADHYIIYCFLRTRFPCGGRSLIGKDIELDAIGFQFESYLTASCICTAAPFKLWCGLEFGWWSNCMQTPEILEDKLFLKQIHALQSVGTMYLWLEPPLAKIKTYSGFWMTLCDRCSWHSGTSGSLAASRMMNSIHGLLLTTRFKLKYPTFTNQTPLPNIIMVSCAIGFMVQLFTRCLVITWIIIILNRIDYACAAVVLSKAGFNFLYSSSGRARHWQSNVTDLLNEKSFGLL